jgi:hypothetical protein
MRTKALKGEKVETMLGSRPNVQAVGINVEEYTTCVRSEYHVEHRSVHIDGQAAPVVFSFIVNALDVVVAKKNNDISAYQWIENHVH